MFFLVFPIPLSSTGLNGIYDRGFAVFVFNFSWNGCGIISFRVDSLSFFESPDGV
jgi:hypothetical protein